MLTPDTTTSRRLLTNRLSTLHSLVRPFYEFVFPPTCFACKGALHEGESKACSSCWKAIRMVAETDELHKETSGHLISSGAICRLFSTFYFDKEGPLQSLIHELKYNGMTNIGVELGRKVGMNVQEYMQAATLDGLIPVPLHKTKLRERGYNQSEYICKGISDVTGLPIMSHLLRRTRYTQSQTKLDIEERRRNVSDAFEFTPSADVELHGKTFVIVDDVITTGATIVECARVLKGLGANSVVACSVALAP